MRTPIPLRPPLPIIRDAGTAFVVGLCLGVFVASCVWCWLLVNFI